MSVTVAELAKEYAQEHLDRRKDIRSTLTKLILASPCQKTALGKAVHTLVSAPNPGSLDDAVDLCSTLGEITEALVTEAWESQKEHIDDRPWHDYLYALIMGLSRSGRPLSLQMALLFRDSEILAAREAMVHALQHIAQEIDHQDNPSSPGNAVAFLKHLSEEDPQSFIRDEAVSALDDMRECCRDFPDEYPTIDGLET